MQCERAQEHFSDYLEQTLEMSVATTVESHLAGCNACREELRSLREAFTLLDSMPQATPPWDGAQQVIARLRALSPEPAVRPVPSPGEWILQFLRRLNPAGVAIGAAMATLIIAGTVMLPPVQGLIRASVAPVGPAESTTPATGIQAPDVSVTLGETTGSGRSVILRLTPHSSIPQAEIHVAGSGQPFTWQGDLGRQRPAELMLTLPLGERSAELVTLVISSPSVARPFRYLVVVPTRPVAAPDVTLFMESQPLEQALMDLAPALGKPIVVLNPAGERVSINAENRAARMVLRDIVGQMRGIVTEDGSAAVISPQP